MNLLRKLCTFISCIWCCCVVLVLSSQSGEPGSAGFVNAQFFECYTTINNLFYNLSSLTGTQISGSDSISDYMFYLNMCAIAPACQRDGAMACQQSTIDPSTLFDLAFPDDTISPHNWTQIPNGIQLTAYGSGIYCGAEGGERKAIVRVSCDSNITTPPTHFTGPIVEGPSCTYTMNLAHISGCGMPTTTTPPPITVPPTATTTTTSASTTTQTSTSTSASTSTSTSTSSSSSSSSTSSTTVFGPSTNPPIPVDNGTTTTSSPHCTCVCTGESDSVDQSKITVAGFGVGAGVGLVTAFVMFTTYMWFKRRNGSGQNSNSNSNKWRKLDDDRSINLTSMRGGNSQSAF